MTDTLEDFRRHLEAKGIKRDNIRHYIGYARRFLSAIDGKPVARISEAEVRAYFASLAKLKASSQPAAVAITAYLKFAAASLPVLVDRQGASLPPPTRKPTRKDLALREKWDLDKLRAEKEAGDALIAQLARQVVNHYVHFEKRLKGAPDDLDELARFADEARALIESNLALFMGLSANGRNINPIFNERLLP